MMLMRMDEIIELVEELNDRLVNQEHPIRATDGTFYASTDGYDMQVSFEEIGVFDDNAEWTNEEESLPPDQLMLVVMRKRLYAHMDAVEAAVNVVENKLSDLERTQNQ